VILTKADRCDRCGAQALHHAMMARGELLLCQHHYNRYASALHAQGWLLSAAVVA
jgi:hypothetical protein